MSTVTTKTKFIIKVFRFCKYLIVLFISKIFSFRYMERIILAKINAAKSFTFNNKKLDYFFHSYNNFGWTERVIEIPIVGSFLQANDSKRVLEIGNVSNHYYDYFRQLLINKTVVDKFESAYDIINLDIGKYKTKEKFDLIFSISTFEHMDSDLGRNPDYIKGESKYISYAYDNMKYVYDTLLDKDGVFIITAPLLYNFEWDETFYSDFSQLVDARINKFVFKRLNENKWIEVSSDYCKKTPQNPYRGYREYLSILEIIKT